MAPSGTTSIDSTPDLTGEVLISDNHPSAAGGFANIWVGHWVSDTHGTHKVAIKVLRTYTENHKHNMRMNKLLRNEIRIWKQLEHVNVLPLYGTVSSFGPCVSMVCPWQENGSLNQFLESNLTLVFDERYRILLGVLSGLSYLHSCSVVHGDLTGSNVLLDEHNTVVLSDFGLSTLLLESGALSHSLSSSVGGRGAVRWAAPEIVIASDDNTIHRPNISSDTYSFGSIALQVLSGQIPYHHIRNDIGVILQLSKGIKPPRPLYPQIQDEIWSLIQRCWDDEPRERPALIIIQRDIEEEMDGCKFTETHEDELLWPPPSYAPNPDSDSDHPPAAAGPPPSRRLTIQQLVPSWVPRTLSMWGSVAMSAPTETIPELLPRAGNSILEQIGAPDHQGWLQKLDANRDGCWKARFFILRNCHLYYLRSDSPEEKSLEGYINLTGCVILDAPHENYESDPCGFQIIYRRDKKHTFRSPDTKEIELWTSALSKAIDKTGEASAKVMSFWTRPVGHI